MADNINVFKLYKEKNCSTITHACGPRGWRTEKYERRHAFEHEKLSPSCRSRNVFIFKTLSFVYAKSFLLTTWNKNGVLVLNCVEAFKGVAAAGKLSTFFNYHPSHSSHNDNRTDKRITCLHLLTRIAQVKGRSLSRSSITESRWYYTRWYFVFFTPANYMLSTLKALSNSRFFHKCSISDNQFPEG